MQKRIIALAVSGIVDTPRHDPFLCEIPDHVTAVWSPLEAIIDRIETDGTVDTAGNKIVFMEPESKEWYDAVAALRGVIDFHKLASSRHGMRADTAPLERFAAKLDHGMPLNEFDLARVREAIASCKQQAMNLRKSQAITLVRDVQIMSALQSSKINR